MATSKDTTNTLVPLNDDALEVRILKRRARKKRYRAAHAEAIRAYNTAYIAAHRGEPKKPRTPEQREARRLYCVAYYAANTEKERTRKAAYRAGHPKTAQAWDAAHPGSGRTRSSTWRRAHPEAVRAQKRQRRALKRGAPINDFTAAQWIEMQVAYDHRCTYCGRRAKGHLTQDHITRLGPEGPHTLHNIIPACRSCNSKKHTGPPPVPVQPMLLTMVPSKKKAA